MQEQVSGIETLRSMIDASERIAIFSGAGISTESGIPDFRSPGGIWTKYQPIMFQDFVASEEMRRESWRRRIAIGPTFSTAAPNRGHRAVAELVRRGKVNGVITQNIDNLHQNSGVPDDLVIELHGNGTYAACLSCEVRYELDPILEAFERDETLPLCTGCGGIIKTATISFGQAMPVGPMQRAEEVSLGCDLFIVLGSSLVVYPAAGFPMLAKRAGASLAIINRDGTDQDAAADLVIHDSIGEVLGSAVGVD